MKIKNIIISLTVWGAVFTILLLAPQKAFAHCDGMDGPVVKAAQKALETGNVNLVLIWVQKQDESAIQKAFQKTLTVRKMSPEAEELADMYFFETVVRIHRAGEGAPYTGLKPAGRDLGPAIPAADKALDEGSVEPLWSNSMKPQPVLLMAIFTRPRKPQPTRKSLCDMPKSSPGLSSSATLAASMT